MANTRILAGYAIDTLGVLGIVPVNADAQIGKAIVNGDWSSSSLVAGITDATSGGFGRNDTIAAGDTPPVFLLKIANILIRGRALGSDAPDDHFGFTAQRIGKASIAGQSLALDRHVTDDLPLDLVRGDFRLVEVGSCEWINKARGSSAELRFQT